MALNIVLLVLGVLGVIVGALALPDSGWKYGLIAFSGVIGLIGFALIVRDWWALPRDENPHLEATLVIDTLSTNEPNFHVELANADGPQITLLQYTYKTPNFSDGVDLPEKMRPIIPKQGKVNIPGKLFSGILNSPTNLDVKLAL